MLLLKYRRAKAKKAIKCGDLGFRGKHQQFMNHLGIEQFRKEPKMLTESVYNFKGLSNKLCAENWSDQEELD